MIKSTVKLRFLFVLALMLQLVSVPLNTIAAETDTSTPSWSAPIRYVALGDSLAFGINSENEIGLGYADFLAQSLSSTGQLKSSNKGFSFPGYTSFDVLSDLKLNVKKPVIGMGHDMQSAQVHDSIKEADLITISVGANDVLPFFKIDSKTAKPTIDLIGLGTAFEKIGVNYNQMLKLINDLNPNAQVYIMEYYNSFPHLASELQPQINQLVVGLNTAIQSGMKGTNARFVPTQAKIAEDFKTYLPNPANIHLSEAGHKVVAESFGNQLKSNYQWLSKDILTATAVDGTSVKLDWKAATDNTAVTGYTIYNGTEKVGAVAGDITSFNVENLVANSTYTFTVEAVDAAQNKSTLNPTATISLGTVEVPGTDNPELLPEYFTDIEKHWAKEFIEQAVLAGMASGYSDGTFRPNQQLTRAQATSILVRALDLKSDVAAPFSDIKNYSDKTQADIAAAYKFGLVKGNKGVFNPNQPVTRAQLALMVKRSYELVKGESYVVTGVAPFVDISKYNAETQHAIFLLASSGIVGGENGKFMPGAATTRGQATKIFVNYSLLVK